MSDSFDVIVIGAGPGGYPAAIRCAQLGLRTACIERELLGGVCLNWGCIPSKALLKTAELAHQIRDAEAFGLKAGPLEIDFPAVVGRSRKVAARFEQGVRGLFKKYGVTEIKGEATITAAGAITIRAADGSERALSAKHIVVATGARARTFPGIEPDGERIVTYREAIVRDVRPDRVVVLGAGAIGLEFAYFWHAMGADVTVVEGMPEILPREDAEVAAAARKQLAKSGIQFKLGTRVEGVTRDGDVCTTKLVDAEPLTSDLVLIALGITPNSDSLGLDALGIKRERGFVVIDALGRTSVDGIYAVGDVTQRGGLAHTATAQAHALADLLASGHAHPVHYGRIPSCTYCQPQVASVGLTESQAKEQGLDVRIGRFPFVANGKAQGANAPHGFVKVLIDRQYGEIVGAHIVGHDATEMIAEFTLALTAEATAEVLLHTVHAHPTFSEAMYEAVADAFGQSVHH